MFVHSGGDGPGSIRYPPLCLTDSEADLLGSVMADSVREVLP
jgi:hypothetical protein